MSDKKITIEVMPESKGIRLDKFLSESDKLELSRNKVQQLIESNYIRVNNQITDKKYKISVGDKIEIIIAPPVPVDITAENIPLDIVYEDDYLAVINKPAGLVTHPGTGNFSGTLVNGIMYHIKQLPNSSPADRPGLVHRLDKNTSGLLVIAKTDSCLQKLQEAIQNRTVKRTYLAIICGHMKEDAGEINLPIGRSIRDRKKMMVTNKNSREAITHYRLLKRYRSYDYLEINLQTGRTHQIRVHFSYLGHPVFGDPEYGGRAKWVNGMFAPDRAKAKEMLEIIDRQTLQAYQLEFQHPVTDEMLSFKAKLPEDFQNVLNMLDDEGC
ncbi:MAG: RluA family pseudouridine synthase [candidate division Zixibacteria bacterium]|nr:RluA family pseudouridine synthase [candidate division Zixibacteria bacterium]